MCPREPTHGVSNSNNPSHNLIKRLIIYANVITNNRTQLVIFLVFNLLLCIGYNSIMAATPVPKKGARNPFTPPLSLYMCYTMWTTENWLKRIEQTSWGTSSSGPSNSCWPANHTLWWLTRSRKGQPQKTRQSQVTATASEKSIKDPEISGTDSTTGNSVKGEIQSDLWR